MATKKGERGLGVDIPVPLYNDVDATWPRFHPLKKKHMVAAALASFLNMDEGAQREAMQRSQELWRLTIGTATGDAVVDEAVAEIDAEDGRPPDERKRQSG